MRIFIVCCFSLLLLHNIDTSQITARELSRQTHLSHPSMFIFADLL